MEIVGPYRVVKELGRGAMGVVFEAFDPAIGRTVALKVIRSQPLATAEEDAQLKLRFAREASAAGRLSHPNIVTVYQFGEHDGTQYLAMEFITGVSLEAMLNPSARLSIDATLSILTQVAAALDYAHAEGIVHRDIKPANILVKPDGTVKLTDFGIARIASQTMTQTGVTMGTPAYMAPEQIMASRVDGRADQYSLAVVAYQMLSGKRPFEASTDQALMFKIVSEEPRPLDELNTLLPRAVPEVIRRGLSKDATQRYRNCSEFIAEIRIAAAPMPIAASPPEVPSIAESPGHLAPPPPAIPRLPRIWPVIAAFVLLAVAVAAWFGSRGAKVSQYRNNAAVIPATQPATNPNAAPSTKPTSLEPLNPGRTPTSAPTAPPLMPAPQTPEKSIPAVRPTEPSGVITAQPAGTTKVNHKDGLTYVWVPSGTFQMGCTVGDGECLDVERPTHEVTITKGFWMGQTLVTQDAYERVVGYNPSHFIGGKLPVETISWNEAVSYCEAVGMRLPTEAEYEYAARSGGTGSRYGNLDRIAWYLDDSGHTTHEVGLKQSNALGFSDMLGNAEVWVSDWYAEYAAGSQRDPSGPASGQNRVVRGGSWATEARNARVSYRFRFGPSVRSNYVGIRCAGNAGGLPVVAPAPVAPRESVKPVLQAGTTKVNEKDGLLYVWIPPGTFQMGCSPGDSECLDNEKPAHEVTIAKGFWMGQVPVTQEAYQRVIGTNPSHFRGEQLPVESVTWNEAQSYCEVAGMRLPTEAEWEYAARAGTTGSRYGDLDRIAWFNRTTTHPVGQKEANAFRLYDMLGSVFEWVADWYADKYPPGPRRDPTGPVSGQARTQRGGSCLKLPRSARASTRSWSAPSTRAYDYGFRCAGN